MTGRDEEWYIAMAEAVKRRERAQSMISQWTSKLNDAESDIAGLTNEAAGPTVQETGAETQE
jgi:ABC-type Fe3+-hydroxamate transport system substrate-binding protein